MPVGQLCRQDRTLRLRLDVFLLEVLPRALFILFNKETLGSKGLVTATIVKLRQAGDPSSGNDSVSALCTVWWFAQLQYLASSAAMSADWLTRSPRNSGRRRLGEENFVNVASASADRHYTHALQRTSTH